MFSWLWLVAGAFAADGASADVLCYPIGPGDVLQLEVVNEPDMSKPLRVGVDGSMEVPFAGRIKVGGLTLEEATAAITAKLANDILKRPQVELRVETYASRLVDVDGGVAKPASYALEKCRNTVSDLLVRAGGLVDASAPVARILRDVAGERQVIEVDLEKLNAGREDADLELRAGDHLYVPPVQSVYVDGQVQKPGAIAYRDGMTVTQAIAQGGGALGTARLARAYIVRGEERIAVNLKRILAGEEADIALRPSDHIFIPESVF